MMSKWKYAYENACIQRHRENMAMRIRIMIPILYFRKLERQRIRWKRSRIEAQTAFVIQRLFIETDRFFGPWKKTTFANRIARFGII